MREIYSEPDQTFWSHLFNFSYAFSFAFCSNFIFHFVWHWQQLMHLSSPGIRQCLHSMMMMMAWCTLCLWIWRCLHSMILMLIVVITMSIIFNVIIIIIINLHDQSSWCTFCPVGFGSVCTRGGFREANKGNGSPKSALTNQRKGFSKIYLVVLYFTDPSLIKSTRFIAMQFQGQKWIIRFQKKSAVR